MPIKGITNPEQRQMESIFKQQEELHKNTNISMAAQFASEIKPE